jgi:hypothetical protein
MEPSCATGETCARRVTRKMADSHGPWSFPCRALLAFLARPACPSLVSERIPQYPVLHPSYGNQIVERFE